MQKIRLETAILCGGGMTTGIMGLFGIILAIANHEKTLIVSGLTYLVLGVVYTISGMERMSNFKLNSIHDWLGPYEVKKPDRFLVISYILNFLGACGNIRGTILLALVFTGHLPLENNDLVIGVLALGFAFTTLGRLYSDDRKYNDIAVGIQRWRKEMGYISEKIHQIDEKLIGRQRRMIRLKPRMMELKIIRLLYKKRNLRIITLKRGKRPTPFIKISIRRRPQVRVLYRLVP